MKVAAKNRAEASSGANARLRDARLESAEEALSVARERVEILQPLHMDIASTRLPPGRVVLRLDSVTGGHDAACPVIRDLPMTMTGPGPNGSGKTTLLALIAGRLQPLQGTVDLLVPFACLDRHAGLLDPALSLRDNFLRLNSDTDENRCRVALARFQFRAADALRKVGDLSGGERLRAGLACTLGQTVPPALLILDEPTNHLDLGGVEALEAALASYDGALVVVSHDEGFLGSLDLDRHIDLGNRPS